MYHPIKKVTTMETREIIVSQVKSNQSNNNVWAVTITGDEQPSAHCKSAYKAMRFMFLLKKQTGLYISGECLSQLSQEIARVKAAQAEATPDATDAVTEEAPSEITGDQPKPKARRKPRTKKNVETAAVPQ